MKQLYLLLVSLLFGGIALSQSVPTVLDTSTVKEIKTVPYDSLQNISSYNLPSLIGQELYFLPNSGYKNNGDYNIDIITTRPRGSVSISKELDGSNLYHPYETKYGFKKTSYAGLVQKKFKIVDYFEIESAFGQPWPIIVLQDPLSGSNLYMDGSLIYPDKAPFVILGYFEKSRQRYIGKKYLTKTYGASLYRKDNNRRVSSNLPDTVTVTDITFLDEQWSPMAMILMGNDSTEYYITVENARMGLRDVAEKEQMDAEREAREAEHLRAMVTKYGRTNGTLIAQGKVRVGFTKQMCKDAWGEPRKVNTTTSRYGKREQWVYYDSYLYFENGKLTSIQN